MTEIIIVVTVFQFLETIIPNSAKTIFIGQDRAIHFEKMNQYHFITHWHVEGTAEEVSAILEDVDSLVRWWPSVYLDVNIIDPGDERGVGKVVSLYTKGWLPYTLRWQFRVIESRSPYGFTLQAWGDFEGRGTWTLSQIGEMVNITYDWEIQANKPLLRALSFLLKPIFSANHRWAMRCGEESLKLELARRRACTPEDAARLPSPPGPTFPHNMRRIRLEEQLRRKRL